ncbi:response regulator [candidate division KSB1 bacterium]|nr:response regulator [candidate division KSB1 bacterium]
MKKILVVDDKKNVRISLGIGLRREGYQVDEASDAIEAIMKMELTHYDVLLSDVKMPVISGIELANTVAKLYPGVKTILMSAYDFKEFEELESEVPKLSKPFEMIDLLNLLDNEPNPFEIVT